MGTRPLRVSDDPEVLLTSAERRRMFDMAMEVHALQPRITDASAAHASLTRQLTEISTKINGRNDVPAEVKASVDALTKDLAGMASKLTAPQGRGGGGGGRGESLAAKVGQAKNGLTAGMAPGDGTMRAYTELKAQAAKSIADLNTTIAKAAALSGTLGKYDLTLTVPTAVKMPEISAPKK